MQTRRLTVTLLLATSPALAGEVRLGLGVFALAPKGADLQLDYRAKAGAWSFGFRHVQWMDTFHDPFTGRALSETTESRTGPLVTYFFQPQGRGSWYLEGAVYRWRKTEKSLVFGDSNTATTTAPAFGGGYTHAIGRWFFWNTGALLSPGTKLKTATSTGSEEDSGTFDIQLQVGVRF
jgi:hypothetical protein